MKCLFEDYENMPEDLAAIIEPFAPQMGNGFDYNDCKDMLQKVEHIGYTFEYGLDAEPYGLRLQGIKLEDLEGFED